MSSRGEDFPNFFPERRYKFVRFVAVYVITQEAAKIKRGTRKVAAAALYERLCPPRRSAHRLPVLCPADGDGCGGD